MKNIKPQDIDKSMYPDYARYLGRVRIFVCVAAAVVSWIVVFIIIFMVVL